MNRDKDLIATTDAHHRPVRVHAQRPGKGLQAKQSESLRVIVQELCESRGGRPGLSVLTSLLVSVDVKNY